MNGQQSLDKELSWSAFDILISEERTMSVSRGSHLRPATSSTGSSRRGFNRREVLTLAWAGTLAAMTLGSGIAAYQFLYPYHRANTFGGKFYIGAATDLPLVGSKPQANVDGRFWLVNTENGPRAFSNVCPRSRAIGHVRIIWDPVRSRFDCPVCGSKFSREGHYITGPAPRSLDQFVIKVVTGHKVFAKTKRLPEEIIAPVVPSPEAKILVDTSKIIEGFASMDSPALRGSSLKVVPGELSA